MRVSGVSSAGVVGGGDWGGGGLACISMAEAASRSSALGVVEKPSKLVPVAGGLPVAAPSAFAPSSRASKIRPCDDFRAEFLRLIEAGSLNRFASRLRWFAAVAAATAAAFAAAAVAASTAALWAQAAATES